MTDRFGDAAGDTLRAVLLFLPKAVAFVLILVAGWLVAKAVLKVVDKVLERVGFDKAVERGGIRRALARSRYDASDLVAKLAYYGVLLVTLQLAFGIWGPNPISDLIAGVIAWLPRAFVAIVIVVVAAAIANAVRDLIGSALGGLSYGRILATIAYVFILGLGVIAALNQIGVATAVTTPVLIAVLATVGGILVVGVGGGLVRPMQNRWESWLSHAERESPLIATHARAYQATRREAAAQQAAAADTTQVVPPTTDSGDVEATQIVTRPVDVSAGSAGSAAFADSAGSAAFADSDVEATQVVPRPASVTHPGPSDAAGSAPGQDTTQVTSRPAGLPTQSAGEDTTQITSRPADLPRQSTGEDVEATMVIPTDPEKYRR